LRKGKICACEKVKNLLLKLVLRYQIFWRSIMAWNVVDVPLGGLPFTTNQIVNLPIPAAIPNNATQVLVFVYSYSGYLNQGSVDRFFDIWTENNNQRIGEMKFYMHIYPQSAVAFNSDNFWLPIVPNNRQLYVQQTAGPLDISNSGGLIKIIGWQ
jgi:hypothetical protein